MTEMASQFTRGSNNNFTCRFCRPSLHGMIKLKYGRPILAYCVFNREPRALLPEHTECITMSNNCTADFSVQRQAVKVQDPFKYGSFLLHILSLNLYVYFAGWSATLAWVRPVRSMSQVHSPHCRPSLHVCWGQPRQLDSSVETL